MGRLQTRRIHVAWNPRLVRLGHLLLVCLLWPFWQTAFSSEKMPVIHLVFENTANPPRHYGNGTEINWDKPGLTLELLREVEKNMGIRFEFQRVPWKRGVFLVANNQVDGLFHASFQPDRLKIGVYPTKAGQPDPERAIFTQRYAFYTLKDQPLLWDGQQVRNLSAPIGVINGYSIVEDLRKFSYPLHLADTQEHLLRMLLNKRLAGIANLENMTDPLLFKHQEAYQAITKQAIPVSEKPYYLIFSHHFYTGQRELAETIWEQIVAIRGSPAFQEIVKTYP